MNSKISFQLAFTIIVKACKVIYLKNSIVSMFLDIEQLRHCDMLYYFGYVKDDVYIINIGGSLYAVYCEFERNGHNWLVI